MNDASTFVLLPSPPPAARRSRSRVVALVGVLALVAAVVGVIVVRGGGRAEAVPLALSFTEGESRTYATETTLDGEMSMTGFGGEVPDGFEGIPISMELSQNVTWDVLSVDADGVATISMSTSDASASFNGMEVPSSELASPPIEMRVASDGRILSIGDLSLAGLDQSSGGLPGMSQVTPLLPEDGSPVAPGDTWDTSFSQDFPLGEGSIAYDVHSTYLRNEDVDGVEAAVIRSAMTVPLDITLRMGDLLSLMEGQEGLPTGEDLAGFEDARIAYAGSMDAEMSNWVDLAAMELLRTNSTGDFDISIVFEGVPEFEGTISFTGSFTQDVSLT